MMANMSVHFSGPSASFLSYEVMNSDGDQEGFLLGQVTTKVTDAISDSQLNYEHKETIVSIECTLSCNRPCSFYDGAGRVDEQSLKRIVGEKYTNLIGWYRFRRNTTLEPFARERAIHNNLTQLIPKARRAFFVLGLLTVTTTENLATHSIDQRFFRFDRFRPVEVLPSSIVSLGSTLHSEYRSLAPNVIEQRGELYENYLPSNKGAECPSFAQSVRQVSVVHTSFQSALERLCKMVSDSEILVTNLKEETRLLKAQIRNVVGENTEDTSEPWTSRNQCAVVGDLLGFESSCENKLHESPTF